MAGTLRCGGSIVSLPVCCCGPHIKEGGDKDEKKGGTTGHHVLVAAPDRLLSIAPSGQLSSLSPHSLPLFPSSPLTALVVSERGSSVWAADAAGRVVELDAWDGAKLAEVEVDRPVVAMAMAGGVAWLCTQSKKEEKGAYKIGAYKFESSRNQSSSSRKSRGKGEEDRAGSRLFTLYKSGTPAPIEVSADGRLLTSHDKFVAVAWRAACGRERGELGGGGGGAKRRKSGRPLPGEMLRLRRTKAITCTAAHPEGKMVAAGDVSGRIVVWRGVGALLLPEILSAPLPPTSKGGKKRENDDDDNGNNPLSLDEELPCTTMHWHAESVSSLCFTLDGRRLCSGGREGVLVLWDLEEGGSRNFLPRLGAPIRHIRGEASNMARLWLSCEDNAVRAVDLAGMQVVAVARGLGPRMVGGVTPPSSSSSSSSSRYEEDILLVPPREVGREARVVVAVAGAATLQVYGIEEGGRHAGVVRVARRNFVAVAPDVKKAEGGGGGGGGESRVRFAAMGKRGSCLVTVDARPDGSVEGSRGSDEGGGMLECLRFWEVDVRDGGGLSGKESAVCVNTITDCPHGTGATLTSLAVHPTRGLCATADAKGCYKIWERRVVRASPYHDPPPPTPTSQGGGGGGVTHWHCTAVGGYQGLPLTALAFSHDGSVMAAGTMAGGGGKATGAEKKGGGGGGGVPLLLLWATETNLLLCAVPLAHVEGGGGWRTRVRWVGFTGDRSSPRVAVITEGGGGGAVATLAVYSLLDPLRGPRWAVRIPGGVACACAGRQSSLVAVTCKGGPAGQGVVMVLDGASPRFAEAPVQCWEVAGVGEEAVVSCGFLETEMGQVEGEELVLVTAGRCIYRQKIKGTEGRRQGGGGFRNVPPPSSEPKGAHVERNGEENGVKKKKEEVVVGTRTPFANTFGQSLTKKTAHITRHGGSVLDEQTALQAAGVFPGSALLDAPAHAVPPLKEICVPFLDAFLHNLNI